MNIFFHYFFHIPHCAKLASTKHLLIVSLALFSCHLSTYSSSSSQYLPMKGSGRNEQCWHCFVTVETAFARLLKTKERKQVPRIRWLGSRRRSVPIAWSKISLPLRICHLKIRENRTVHMRVSNFLLFFLLLGWVMEQPQGKGFHMATVLNTKRRTNVLQWIKYIYR